MKITSRHNLRLGVTGGIGSGKTTVCRVFSVLGIPVFSADIEAKRIQDTDPDIKDKINTLAGKDLYSSGKLDRKELASLIFNNKDLLWEVNSVVHPAVINCFRKWIEIQNAPYSIMEAAILFESGAYRMMDRIVTIVTPLEERIDRLVKGNKLTREQIADRIRNQIDDESRIKKSDYVIYNSENDMIIPAILVIHQEMLKLHNNSTQ
jgi:dephospho-CoA kinase